MKNKWLYILFLCAVTAASVSALDRQVLPLKVTTSELTNDKIAELEAEIKSEKQWYKAQKKEQKRLQKEYKKEAKANRKKHIESKELKHKQEVLKNDIIALEMYRLDLKEKTAKLKELKKEYKRNEKH